MTSVPSAPGLSSLKLVSLSLWTLRSATRLSLPLATIADTALVRSWTWPRLVHTSASSLKFHQITEMYVIPEEYIFNATFSVLMHLLRMIEMHSAVSQSYGKRAQTVLLWMLGWNIRPTRLCSFNNSMTEKWVEKRCPLMAIKTEGARSKLFYRSSLEANCFRETKTNVLRACKAVGRFTFLSLVALIS